MTTIPARRKHGACLLRIKENCPFRKLRKNRCYDVTATSSVNGGVLWTDYSEHPISASSDQPIIAISGEPLPPLPTYQAHYRHQHLQGPVAMDMEDIVQGPSPKIGAMRPNPSSGLTPRSLLPILTPPNSESSMELDSGVDPETGERAQK